MRTAYQAAKYKSSRPLLHPEPLHAIQLHVDQSIHLRAARVHLCRFNVVYSRGQSKTSCFISQERELFRQN
jgi:hypothetical protein